jgi:hypothetical protein
MDEFSMVAVGLVMAGMLWFILWAFSKRAEQKRARARAELFTQEQRENRKRLERLLEAVPMRTALHDFHATRGVTQPAITPPLTGRAVAPPVHLKHNQRLREEEERAAARRRREEDASSSSLHFGSDPVGMIDSLSSSSSDSGSSDGGGWGGDGGASGGGGASGSW